MRLLTECSTVVVLGFCLFVLGCNTRQDPEQLKERTAAATAELKRDAKAVAEGIREGWNRDRQLDLNRATEKELLELPGINSRTANRIVANRPYKAADELVTKRIVSRQQYEKIADRITVKK
ncbi:MAG TPA: helix-hairpin-helix domain-containing protein [Terriglobales bacterium]|nr:helix-hairpin-helix domain-containing protein [Terriglobales bacterium]